MPDLFYTRAAFIIIEEVYAMAFMNRGMQNRRQRKVVIVIISIVILSFLSSIVVYAVL